MPRRRRKITTSPNLNAFVRKFYGVNATIAAARSADTSVEITVSQLVGQDMTFTIAMLERNMLRVKGYSTLVEL